MAGRDLGLFCRWCCCRCWANACLVGLVLKIDGLCGVCRAHVSSHASPASPQHPKISDSCQLSALSGRAPLAHACAYGHAAALHLPLLLLQQSISGRQRCHSLVYSSNSTCHALTLSGGSMLHVQV